MITAFVNMEERVQKNQHTSVSLSSIFTSLFMGTLVLGAGFFAGWYWQQASAQDYVKIEVVQTSVADPQSKDVLGKTPSLHEARNEQNAGENCEFVGSKNSDKYHLPESGAAKRIKEVNKVCFSSQEEAEAKGYQAGMIQ